MKEQIKLELDATISQILFAKNHCDYINIVLASIVSCIPRGFRRIACVVESENKTEQERPPNMCFSCEQACLRC